MDDLAGGRAARRPGAPPPGSRGDRRGGACGGARARPRGPRDRARRAALTRRLPGLAPCSPTVRSVKFAPRPDRSVEGAGSKHPRSCRSPPRRDGQGRPGPRFALADPGRPLPASSRDKILDVAEALFARRGYAGVGLREVADAGRASASRRCSTTSAARRSSTSRCCARVLERIDERVRPEPRGGRRAGRASRPRRRRADRRARRASDHGAPAAARRSSRTTTSRDRGGPRRWPRPSAPSSSSSGACCALLHEGIEAGAFRAASPGHVLQTLIGAIVYHFASGEFGEGMIGAPLFSAERRARAARTRSSNCCSAGSRLHRPPPSAPEETDREEAARGTPQAVRRRSR